MEYTITTEMQEQIISDYEIDYDGDNYILGEKLVKKKISANISIDSGNEWRLQDIFGYEIWKKLDLLGMNKKCWREKNVLDVCCGTGFVSYHLLKNANPKKVVMLDISKSEVQSAKKLMNMSFPNKEICYVRGNAIKTAFKDESFDIIIGNSFLHHFYNVPLAMKEFRRLLKKDGIFIALHEPTSAAIILERGRILLFIASTVFGDKYLQSLRGNSQGVSIDESEDIWLFDEKKVRNILLDNGMHQITIKHFHLLRPFFIGKFSLHLNKNKPELSALQSNLLKICIDSDAVLSQYIPVKYFGSLTIKATK